MEHYKNGGGSILNKRIQHNGNSVKLKGAVNSAPQTVDIHNMSTVFCCLHFLQKGFL